MPHARADRRCLPWNASLRDQELLSQGDESGTLLLSSSKMQSHISQPQLLLTPRQNAGASLLRACGGNPVAPSLLLLCLQSPKGCVPKAWTCGQMHCALKLVGTLLAAMQALCAQAAQAGDMQAYCVRWTPGDTACCCAGWRYESMLCEADNVDTGVMWECPLLLELQQAPSLPWQHSVRGVGSLRTIMDSHTALGNGSSPTEGWPTTLTSIKEARNQVGKTPGC